MYDTEGNGALHESFDPPPKPLQFHVNGPDHATAVASHAAHKPLVGAVRVATQFAAQHDQFVKGNAQFTFAKEAHI